MNIKIKSFVHMSIFSSTIKLEDFYKEVIKLIDKDFEKRRIVFTYRGTSFIEMPEITGNDILSIYVNNSNVETFEGYCVMFPDGYKKSLNVYLRDYCYKVEDMFTNNLKLEEVGKIFKREKEVVNED